MDIQHFQTIIWNYYREHKRSMPWRSITDTYGVYLSEIMLQQTQVSRVLDKYPQFIRSFPKWDALAHAPTHDLLAAWQGMGYNRRALYMRETARKVVTEYGGQLPQDPKVLVTFPGIGKATAGSLVAFAYNIPTVFIETNIRRVFIHHFFADKEGIADTELIPLVEQSVDKKNPREWYYALMDYGTHLPKTGINANKRSKHYAVQSKFEGSRRQIRGAVIRELTKGPVEETQLRIRLGFEKDTLDSVLLDLKKEGFIHESGGVYQL